MNDREFVRRARRYARRYGLEFSFNPSDGKGSHAKLWVGGLVTTVPHGEIKPGTLASMFRELEINRREF